MGQHTIHKPGDIISRNTSRFLDTSTGGSGIGNTEHPLAAFTDQAQSGQLVSAMQAALLNLLRPSNCELSSAQQELISRVVPGWQRLKDYIQAARSIPEPREIALRLHEQVWPLHDERLSEIILGFGNRRSINSSGFHDKSVTQLGEMMQSLAHLTIATGFAFDRDAAAAPGFGAQTVDTLWSKLQPHLLHCIGRYVEGDPFEVFNKYQGEYLFVRGQASQFVQTAKDIRGQYEGQADAEAKVFAHLLVTPFEGAARFDREGAVEKGISREELTRVFGSVASIRECPKISGVLESQTQLLNIVNGLNPGDTSALASLWEFHGREIEKYAGMELCLSVLQHLVSAPLQTAQFDSALPGRELAEISVLPQSSEQLLRTFLAHGRSEQADFDVPKVRCLERACIARMESAIRNTNYRNEEALDAVLDAIRVAVPVFEASHDELVDKPWRDRFGKQSLIELGMFAAILRGGLALEKALLQGDGVDTQLLRSKPLVGWGLCKAACDVLLRKPMASDFVPDIVESAWADIHAVVHDTKTDFPIGDVRNRYDAGHLSERIQILRVLAMLWKGDASLFTSNELRALLRDSLDTDKEVLPLTGKRTADVAPRLAPFLNALGEATDATLLAQGVRAAHWPLELRAKAARHIRDLVTERQREVLHGVLSNVGPVRRMFKSTPPAGGPYASQMKELREEVDLTAKHCFALVRPPKPMLGRFKVWK